MMMMIAILAFTSSTLKIKPGSPPKGASVGLPQDADPRYQHTETAPPDSETGIPMAKANEE
jgi:hypothetical protein